MTYTTTPSTRLGRTAALVAGLAMATLAGTACEPPPTMPTCMGFRTTIVGTAGDDVLRGTSGPDVIAGLGGRDVIQGLDGDDRLCGGDGVDQVHGGEGRDTVEGGLGRDVLTGDIGVDTLHYGAHPQAVAVNLLTASGTDDAHLGTFEDIVGSAFDDMLTGDDGPNHLVGGRGSDHLSGRGGDDHLLDQTAAAGDRNLFEGGSGSDVMRGSADTARDYAGFEDSAVPVFVNLGTQRASGFGDDTLEGIDGVLGGRAADTIYGSNGRDVLYGGGGDDLLVPLGGDDTVVGLAGRDTISYYAASGIDLDLTQRRATGEGIDTLHDIEDVQGSPGHDYLVGDAGANLIDGGRGQDLCVGGGGADSFIRCP